MNLEQLPDVVIENVFSFLTFDGIARNRLVCRRFNSVGCKALNRGFYAADRYHSKTLKSFKAKLPRRESERRMHPLSRQCDILISVETRLSMLSMTYTKWIEANLCCFIPGKVIDEIMKVLRCVSNNPSPPRANEILQELRDISSMAMEHFDEKILPGLLHAQGLVSPILSGSLKMVDWMSDSKANPPFPTIVRVSYPYSPRPTSTPSTSSNRNDPCTITVAEYRKLLFRMKSQSLIIAKQASELAELRRQIEEGEAKFRDLVVKLNMSKLLDSPVASTSSRIESTSGCKRKLDYAGDEPDDVPEKNSRLQ